MSFKDYKIYVFFFAAISLVAWTERPTKKQKRIQLVAQKQWVDSVFNALSEEQRLGQLFMIRAHSNRGQDHINFVKKQIKDFGIGGLCFFQGTPDKQLKLTNDYQRMTNVPLMISMDAEWGLGMRLKKSTISYPRQLTLGAIQDNHIIYDMGKEVARQMRRLGVHINFAPVVDVNNNPKNPVINTRSFGEDPFNVTAKSYMYAKGMQDHGVMACAKHFPGHGDTDVDSHHDLPVITHDRKRLDSVEMFPFRVLSQFGIESVMVAHLKVPALDATPNLPTTLSRKVINVLLKKEMNFKGLVFTDALEMKGVTKHFPPGEIEVRALEAGVDVLLMPEDIQTALTSIDKALASGRLKQRDLDARVKKILRSKYRLGLLKKQELEPKNLSEELNSKAAKALNRDLIAKSFTLAVDDGGMIPFKKLDGKTFATVSLGSNAITPFQKMLFNYKSMEHFSYKDLSGSQLQSKIDMLKSKDVVIVGLHDMSSYASKNWGLSETEIEFVNRLSNHTEVVLVVFGNPYCLKYFESQKHVLVANNDDEDAQELAAQALFGVTGIKGRLPITASPKFKYNTGVSTNKIFRMGYGQPEDVGIDPAKLLVIDTLAKKAISRKATPGMVVLIAKDGKIVFNKAYGKHSYKKDAYRTQKDDVFDLASITKVASSTISLMKLQDEGKFGLNEYLGTYLTHLDTTDKKRLITRDILAHRSGLKSWIPYYKKTLTQHKRKSSRKPLRNLYSKTQRGGFSVPVAKGLYMKNAYLDTLQSRLYTATVFETKKYRYSDLGFQLLGEVIEKQSGQSIDQYVENQFYKSLGLEKTMFNPWKKISTKTVVPTERDRYFRHQTIQGYVHDMGAAMTGGVAGHAGLFSTTKELAILMQMLLNQGYYGGEQYIRPETVREYTSKHPNCTRRGFGFDMKELNYRRNQNLPRAASENTFGHIGFTGTCVWADPDQQLIYVFLSNRTYPSQHNKKLNQLNTRGKIHAAIYKAIEKPVNPLLVSQKETEAFSN